MRIVTAVDGGMSFDGGRVFEPGERLVVTDWAAGEIRRRMAKHDLTVRLSSAGDWTRRPRPEAFRAGQTLISWRGLAYGDQLVWGGMLAILARRCPGLRIRHYCAGAMAEELWKGAENLPFEVARDPIPFDDWRAADWHLIGSGLNEDDLEPDQPDIWTGHLRAAGIDPESVPWSERRPLVPMSAATRKIGRHLMAIARTDGGSHEARPVVLWQLAASTPVRSYAPEPTRAALAGLVAAGCRVLVVGTPKQIEEYMPLPDGVEPLCDAMRVLFGCIAAADCVVCPDSVFGWAAAGLDTPCVSLWGSFLPSDRIGSESSHRPLVGAAACVPCRKHEKPWLSTGCPEHGGGYCRAIAAIEPQAIVEQVSEIVTRRS